jgi:photosystem II stability/assembly factor-like uncharacterized protein
MRSSFTRTFFSVVFALAAAVFPHRLLAGVGEWTTSGPHGGAVIALAADPSDRNALYAATDRQLYKSVNGGENWAPALSGRFDILLPTSDPAIVYATSLGQTYLQRSTDGGSTWTSHWSPQPVGWEEGLPIRAVAVDPRDPRTLYVLVSQSTLIANLYRSTNGAESWELVPNPPASGVGLTGIAVDPDDSAVLYVSALNGARTSGVYRSSNRGITWTLTGLQQPTSSVQAVRNPSRVFAISTAGVQVTTNGGTSWSRILPGTAVQFPTLLAIDPANGSRLYAVSGGVLFQSADGGATATRSPGDEFGGMVQAIVVDSSGTVFAGSRTGIYRSADAATSWTGASGGISEIAIQSLAVDPADGSVVFAASETGIHQSRDGRRRQVLRPEGSPSIRRIARRSMRRESEFRRARTAAARGANPPASPTAFTTS